MLRDKFTSLKYLNQQDSRLVTKCQYMVIIQKCNHVIAKVAAGLFAVQVNESICRSPVIAIKQNGNYNC